MPFDPDMWGTVSDWVVAVTAVGGVGAGLAQLSAIRRTNRQSVQLERAKLLMELDRDFEGEALLAARQRTLVVHNRIEQEVRELRPILSEEKQREEIATRFSAYMTGEWQRSRTFDGDAEAAKDSASQNYMTLMRLPFWCETVGHQCRRDLLPLDDVLNLYDQLVIFVIGDLVEHIKVRAEEGPHRNPRYLENALWLYAEACQYKAARDTPATLPVKRSGLDWQA